MKRSKPTTLPLGTISEGTLRPDDLIRAYIAALEDLRLSKIDRQTLQRIDREFNAMPSNDRWGGTSREPVLDWNDEQQEQGNGMIEELTDILENHVPDYAYFGSLEGDGACFGVWPLIDQLHEDSSAVHSDVFSYDEPPNPQSDNQIVRYASQGKRFTHWMHVNDHGNVTLYRRAGNRWIEVWSVV